MYAKLNKGWAAPAAEYRLQALQVLVQVESQPVPPPASAVRTVHFLGQKVFQLLDGFLWQQGTRVRHLHTKRLPLY